LGLKIDSTQSQSKSFKIFAKFAHLNSWVVTSGDGGQWNGCGSLTAAERNNQPPSDLPAVRVGGDGADTGRCGRGQSSVLAVFSKAMKGVRKWWGGELATGSGNIHGRWRSLPRRTVGAVYERQRRRRLQSEASPRSLGGAKLGDEARHQHALLGEDARWRWISPLPALVADGGVQGGGSCRRERGNCGQQRREVGVSRREKDPEGGDCGRPAATKGEERGRRRKAYRCGST
jgi:hypothetical protein